jgi:hypothetical protein
MFAKVEQLAEQAANEINISRRGFVSRICRVASVAAGAIGGVLLTSGTAQAGCRNPAAYQTCVTACWNWCLSGGRSGTQCTKLCSDRKSGCLKYC